MGPSQLAGQSESSSWDSSGYQVYGREKTTREGAALDAIRRSADAQSLKQVEQAFANGAGTIVVTMDEQTTTERERPLLDVAASVAAARDGQVHAVRFEEVPEQLSLSSATERDESDRSFEVQTEALADSFPAEIVPREIVSHNQKRAVVNYVDDVNADLLLGEWVPDHFHAELLGSNVDWFMKHATCDTVFLRDQGLDSIDDITVVTRQGLYRPLKVLLADALATRYDVWIRFITAINEESSEEQVRAAESYHAELADLCIALTESTVIRTYDIIDELVATADGSDIAVVGTVAHSWIHELVLGDLPIEFSDRVEATVLLAHSRELRSRSLIRELVECLAF